MRLSSALRRMAAWSAAGLAVAAGAYVVYAGMTWCRYGQAARGAADEKDALLDRFMPTYDVADRHHIRVDAPAAVTLDIARELELFQLPVVRALVRARACILGAGPDDRPRPRGLLAETQSLGWVVLAEMPDREVVVGAVTRPWEANVTFRSIPSHEFADFAEPDYVKIVWTLRADPVGGTASIFHTETRAVATDPGARAKFRRYWSFLSPGIRFIRLMSLRPVRSAAERRTR